MPQYNIEHLIYKEDGKWVYGDEFIQWIKDNSKKFKNPTDLSKSLGVYLDLIHEIERKYKFEFNYNKNSSKFKAIYQDYDWCYQKYMVEGLNHEEMAKQANCSKRVIEKWCCEKHRITQKFRQQNVELNDVQKDLIIGSLLGDGHIDRRDTQPIFIVSHADNQKDYLYWKYDLIKNLCNIEPQYISPKYASFGNDKKYLCRGAYRSCTRTHDCLIKYRDMNIVQLLEKLNELSFAIWILDDGHRGDSNWHICFARFSQDEKDHAIRVLRDKFDFDAYILESDNRYLHFKANDSRRIDQIITNNLPNNLDIVKYKITENDKIKEEVRYRYVDIENQKKGLASFCKKYSIPYKKAVEVYDNGIINGMELIDFLKQGDGVVHEI